jgi:chloramphenicol-sensitive protein RarD
MISLLPFLTLFMWFSGDLSQICDVWHRVKQRPTFILALIVTALLAAVQLWLFIWAPMNGRGMQVSLGYFLLPLVLALVGRLFYKEQLSGFQQVALFLATLGVAHELWRAGGLAWETLLVAIGYSAYFFMRKLIKTDHLGGFWWDNVLALPIAIYCVQNWTLPWHTFLQQPSLIVIVMGLGFFSAIGLSSYIVASRYLPLALFGLLSYLEPILLAGVSLVLGEKIAADGWFTYIPIWLAVGVLALEGAFSLHQSRDKLLVTE